MNNRIIKFRAWHKKLHEMFDLEVLSLPDWVVVKNGQEWNRDPETGEAECQIEEGDFELMQFTGLLDKNGKEIYEGDILYGYDPLGDSNIRSNYPIEWSNLLARFKMVTPHQGFADISKAKMEDYEIIGNIYENPELLTETKQEKSEEV